MLDPMKVPQGGYNQEYRQHPKFPGGYIYSHAGGDYDAWMNAVYPLLPDRVAFGDPDAPAALVKDEPGTNGVPQTAVLYPYPGTPSAGTPWAFTLMAGRAAIDFLLIARILFVQPVLNPDGTASAWSSGLIERHTETTLLAGNPLTELVGEQGDRYALVASFPGADCSNPPPPPPGYVYKTRPLDQDFTLVCRRFAHILITDGYNFQRWDQGNAPD